MPANGRDIPLLVVGREPALRETYAMLFSRAGYKADHADAGDSLGRFHAGEAGVLVIDHTLSKDQRQFLVHLARQISRNIKIVALHSSAKDCGADLVMDSREGPSAILAGVAKLLERRRWFWTWFPHITSLLPFSTSRSGGKENAGKGT